MTKIQEIYERFLRELLDEISKTYPVFKIDKDNVDDVCEYLESQNTFWKHREDLAGQILEDALELNKKSEKP